MDKKILLIGDENGFMVRAIVKGLTDADFEVHTTKTNVTEIDREIGEEGINLILMYLEDEMDNVSETLIYLKDYVSNSDETVLLFMVGDEMQLNGISRYIPSKFMAGTYCRPINVKELTAQMDAVIERASVQEERKRILIVDDDGVMLRTLKDLLEKKYTVFMANSGMNALTFLAQNKVDLILLDYVMPVVDGPKVLEMLRSEPATAGIPVMFLTGKGDKESIMKVVNLKPEKYLLKTMPPGQLMWNIDRFFEQQKMQSILS